ncbi:hypothetical protein L6452_20032 [Arctium lappa]|uniref:Uncharacterized protein n=1 Tax=Arctium lappa TaxID=4217 RepID=A0ACB9BB24_ARCLA|nr:hypothetical protein L6452_20032 [Arctium lappa]
MKITALLVLKCDSRSDGSDPVGRTVAKRTPDQRHSVQHEGCLISKIEILHVIYKVFDVVLRELGIGIVPYSPIGRGFLVVGPKLAENLIEGDFRKAIECENVLYDGNGLVS